MDLFFLLFGLFALLLVGNAVRWFIAAAKGQNQRVAIASGIISVIAAVAIVVIGHYMFNF